MAVHPNTLANLTAGRKGQPAKYKQAIKDMVETALGKAGGVDYLVAQAEKNPVAFMGLVGKLLPKDIAVDLRVDGQSLSQVLIERREQLAAMKDITDATTFEHAPVGEADTGTGKQRRMRKVRSEESGG